MSAHLRLRCNQDSQSRQYRSGGWPQSILVCREFQIGKVTENEKALVRLKQRVVVRKLVKDLDIPVDMVMAPTIREEDGLALSMKKPLMDGCR